MGSERVTLSQFRAVEEGMSYGEVVRLLGREGTLDSRTDGSDGPVISSYYWWNDNKSYVEAAFENDRLVYKNQSRLRQRRSWPGRLAPPRPAGASFERIPYVTLRQFRALERGMSYREVVRRLGREGTPDSRTDGFDGPVTATYHWWNDNKSYVEAAFENDRLIYKNQSRLRQVDPRRLPPLRLRSLGRDAEEAPPPHPALIRLHEILKTWLPVGGTVLVAAIAFLAFWLGEGLPEPTGLDLFFATGVPVTIIVWTARAAATDPSDPVGYVAVTITTLGWGLAANFVMLYIVGIPVVGASVWWLIFLFWCWLIRVSSDAYEALACVILAALSCAVAVLVLI